MFGPKSATPAAARLRRLVNSKEMLGLQSATRAVARLRKLVNSQEVGVSVSAIDDGLPRRPGRVQSSCHVIRTYEFFSLEGYSDDVEKIINEWGASQGNTIKRGGKDGTLLIRVYEEMEDNPVEEDFCTSLTKKTNLWTKLCACFSLAFSVD